MKSSLIIVPREPPEQSLFNRVADISKEKMVLNPKQKPVLQKMDLMLMFYRGRQLVGETCIGILAPSRAYLQ